MMTHELVYEAWRSDMAVDLPAGQPLRYRSGDGGAGGAAAEDCWLRLSLVETDGSAGGAVELGVATPLESEPDGAVVDAVRVWPRGSTPGDDALVVLSWLRDNALAERLGVDSALPVQLFIEAAVNGAARSWACNGEYLATLVATAQGPGTAATSRWSLAMRLSAPAVAAVLDAITASGAQWGYAIVAARDADSPAGRIRRRLLDDLRA